MRIFLFLLHYLHGQLDRLPVTIIDEVGRCATTAGKYAAESEFETENCDNIELSASFYEHVSSIREQCAGLLSSNATETLVRALSELHNDRQKLIHMTKYEPLTSLLNSGELSYLFVDNLAKVLSYARQFWREQIRDEESRLEMIEEQFLETLDLISAVPVVKRINFKPKYRKVLTSNPSTLAKRQINNWSNVNQEQDFIISTRKSETMSFSFEAGFSFQDSSSKTVKEGSSIGWEQSSSSSIDREQAKSFSFAQNTERSHSSTQLDEHTTSRSRGASLGFGKFFIFKSSTKSTRTNYEKNTDVKAIHEANAERISGSHSENTNRRNEERKNQSKSSERIQSLTSHLGLKNSKQFGSEYITTKEQQHHFPVNIPPKTSVIATARITKIETEIPFSVFLDLGGQETKLSGQWMGILVNDVEYDIREYSLADQNNNEEDFNCEDISNDLQTCYSEYSSLSKTSRTTFLRDLKQKNSQMAENNDLKKSLERAQKKICELKEQVSVVSSPIALFHGDNTGMQSYVIKDNGGKSVFDLQISDFDAESDDFPFRYSISVAIRGQVYIFGGTSKTQTRIAKVDGCKILIQPQTLVEPVSKASSVVALTDENAALICFEQSSFKKCQKFNGELTKTTGSTKYSHRYSCLAINDNEPITISSSQKDGYKKVEQFNGYSWRSLADFPKAVKNHCCVGVEKGVLVIGGTVTSSTKEVFLLRESKWKSIGKLKRYSVFGTPIVNMNTIFIISGYTQDTLYAVEKIIIYESKIVSTEVIHEHPFKTRRPIAFELDQQRCNEQLKEKIEKTENELNKKIETTENELNEKLNEKQNELDRIKAKAASECYSGDELSRDLCGVNPCLENPCLNRGTCVPEAGPDYKCICPKFFNGERCEMEFHILVMLEDLSKSFLMNNKGSTTRAIMKAPRNDYLKYSLHALVNGQLHIFGGATDSKKIARLEGCQFKEMPVKLNDTRDHDSAALSIHKGSKVLICFNAVGDKNTCEIFDGEKSLTTNSTSFGHALGGLGMYRRNPTTVGGLSPNHSVAESLNSTGWYRVPSHPTQSCGGHSLIGLEDESMLFLGGLTDGSFSGAIWQLKDDEWKTLGSLKSQRYRGGHLYYERSIFDFSGWETRRSSYRAIQRINLDEKENLDNAELESQILGHLPIESYTVILLPTVSKYCV